MHADQPGDPPGTGRVVGYEYLIHPEEAETIRRIFRLYADGMSGRQIAARLNANAVLALTVNFTPRTERDTGKVVLTGSVAFKLAEMSAGRGDATFTLTPKNEWDICAGSLLVEEAGGRVTGLDGKPLQFNQPSPLRPGMVASNGGLHDGLMALIAELGDQVPKAPPRRR